MPHTDRIQTEKNEVIVTNILRPRLLKYSELNKLSIKAARERLAIALQCDERLVTRWMNNNSQPTLTQAISIAKFLSLPVESVFTIHNA